MVLSILALGLSALVMAHAPAQAQSGFVDGVIETIVIEGTQRIEPATVRTYLTIREGDAYDPPRVDKSLKDLFDTGLFKDVAFRREGTVLYVSVVENPIINRIAFEGNRRVDDETLGAAVQLRPRVVYTLTKVQEDVQRIIEVYRRSGRYAVSVDPKIIELPQNRVDIAFEINEGPSTTVRSVAFVGNRIYSDSRLREVIETSEETWYAFFSSTDTYDPDRLTFDRELLRRYYLRNGYADFEVKSAIAELSQDRQSFFITFTVEEGQRYRFSEIDVESTLEGLDPAVLAPHIESVEGDWYDSKQLEDTVDNLTEAVGSMGYAFVEVRPRVRRDREAQTVSITYSINEGPRVFVERIDINGNVRTLDEVIRREILLVEGDAFNTAKLRRSRARIQDLGFFSRVEVTNTPSPTAGDRTIVAVEVEEQSTGEISFGLGWSSTVGAIIEVGLRERNLLGRGQDFNISLTWAERRSELDLSFTEPYFLDRRLRAGFDLFAVERNLQDESSFDRRTLGGRLRIGFDYNEELSHSFRYTLQYDRIFNVDSNASRVIQDQPRESLQSEIGHVLTYDNRDSRLNPTDGYVISLGNDFAGLGGTEYFVRTNVRAGYYVPVGDYFDIDDTWVLSVTGRGGYIVGVYDDVRINERFFLGGENLRGFASAGASPRDRNTDDALGANWMVAGTVQMQMPLGLPNELGITGRVFTDFGTSGRPDDFDSTFIDADSSLRMSIGGGLTWVSPLGPISVDLGWAVLKEDYDEDEIFRLTFGSRF